MKFVTSNNSGVLPSLAVGVCYTVLPSHPNFFFRDKKLGDSGAVTQRYLVERGATVIGERSNQIQIQILGDERALSTYAYVALSLRMRR